MAPRTGKRLQDRGRDTPTKELLWQMLGERGEGHLQTLLERESLAAPGAFAVTAAVLISEAPRSGPLSLAPVSATELKERAFQGVL